MKINSFKYSQRNSLMHLWKYSKKRLKNVVWHFMLLCFSVFPVLNICPLVLYHFSSMALWKRWWWQPLSFQPCFNGWVTANIPRTWCRWQKRFINSILHKPNVNSLYANRVAPFLKIITGTALFPQQWALVNSGYRDDQLNLTEKYHPFSFSELPFLQKVF